jgi:hypothetical protein
VKAISKEEITKSLNKAFILYGHINSDQFGYYIAGLLEGDGNISIPALGNTTTNRVFNPRIVFSGHINNLPLYAYIQSRLNGVGRFQVLNDSVIRYIIGDVKGINAIIELMHGKLRTPKNLTFNKLILFMNNKYNTSIGPSVLDTTSLSSNS